MGLCYCMYAYVQSVSYTIVLVSDAKTARLDVLDVIELVRTTACEQTQQRRQNQTELVSY